jgi:hypothetical protein
MRPQEGQRDATPVPPLPEAIPAQTPVQEEPSAFLTELTEEPFDYLGFTAWHDELRLVRPINEEGIAIKIIEVLNTHAG